METQQRDLEARLAADGWRITARERGAHWWLGELWCLQSDWHPLGLTAWVSFLVDPSHDGVRRSGEHVWAVAITATRPDERENAAPTELIRRRWSESAQRLLDRARAIRDEATGRGR